MFKKLFTVMLMTIMCITALTACGESDDSSDTHHTLEGQKQNMNTMAKLVYNEAMNLCHKSTTDNKQFAAAKAKTNILVITSGGDGADIAKLVDVGSGSGIPTANIEQLKKTVNKACTEIGDGMCYIIQFSDIGFPSQVYISNKEDGSFVGGYPKTLEDDEDGAYSLKSFLD